MKKLSLGLGFSDGGNSGGGAPAFARPNFTSADKLIIVGDSITQQNNGMTAVQSRTRADGYFNWASRDIPSIKTGIWYDTTATAGAAPPLFRGYNFGLAGEAADTISERTTPMINYGGKCAIVMAGTNTGDDNSSFAAKTAALQSILDDLIGGGYFVILGTIWARGTRTSPTGSQLTPAQMAIIIQVNDWIRARESNDVAIWDPWDDMVDPQYTQGVDPEYGSPKAGLLEDWTHPAQLGAFTAAKTLRPILNQIYPNSNQYTDAWFKDLTNIITNGTLIGTSGFAQNGVTGDVPSNFVSKFVVANADVSGVGIMESNTDTGGQSHKVTITCGGTGSATAVHTYQLQPLAFIVNEPALTDGDYVRFFVKIRVRNNNDGMIGAAQARLFNQTQGRNDYAFQGTATTRQDEPYPTGDLDIWLQTQPTRYTAGNISQPIFNVEIFKNIAGSVDIYIDKVQLSAVGDPEIEFPYTP